YVGRRLGDRLAGRMLGKFAVPLSGVLLIALGAWEVLG
ncbi:MAG: sporulation protein, partial [Flavonifractor sp.]|nr:sporulation protein [Flavonifractor sp.]